MTANTPSRPPTWIEVAVTNGGFRKALKALVWAQIWGVTREAVGHDPTVEEVADWWRASLRTTYREQAAFRECFPTLDSPAPLVDAPQVREAFAKAARAGDGIENVARAARKPQRPTESLTLQLAMGPASF